MCAPALNRRVLLYVDSTKHFCESGIRRWGEKRSFDGHLVFERTVAWLYHCRGEVNLADVLRDWKGGWVVDGRDTFFNYTLEFPYKLREILESLQ